MKTVCLQVVKCCFYLILLLIFILFSFASRVLFV